MVVLLFAVVFDYADGKVARLMKREGDFGKQLDSLADTISFGVAPAIFGFSLIQTNFALIVFIKIHPIPVVYTVYNLLA